MPVICAAIAFGIGFGATLLIRNIVRNGSSYMADEQKGTENMSGTMSVQRELPDTPAVTGHAVSDSAKNLAIGDTPVHDAVPVILKIDGPSFMVRERAYSVTVHTEVPSGTGSALKYNLYDDSRNLVKSVNTDRFAVPQSESGIYYVTVTDTSTGKSSVESEIKGCVVRRMSKARLEQICNSGDYTTMRNAEAYELSPDIKLEFVGDTGGQGAVSIDDICTRISLGIWSSVSVAEIEYDDLNLVKFVKFQVSK